MEEFNLQVIIFWAALFIIFYTYAGYGVVLYFLVKLKRIFRPGRKSVSENFEPEVAFIVPCYNEAEFIEEKINNCLALDYPADKLKIIFITDGSTDATPDIIRKHSRITLLHESRRAGKSAAENRSMRYVDAPVVIFSDANTILPSDAVKYIVKHYADPAVGAVSGEKRIMTKETDSASGAGEGIYWKYESFLKRMDSELHTIVGAAGELFSFRRELFTELEEDTILDDFMLSMRIVRKGYRVVYEPNAYAMETSSATVREELKRKIRICAGGWQAMSRLKSLMNPFSRPLVAFQYLSHRVLRWSLTPLLLILLMPLNIVLFDEGLVYRLMLAGQFIFYIAAMLGWYFANRQIRIKALFVPYYFFIMNYAVVLGFFRWMRGRQPAAWERAARAPAKTDN